MWDPVPWAVGGGAEHSPNVARNVAFAAFGGQEGIVSPQACEVRELAVPGSSVRVFPGTVAVQNRATGTQDEMYVGRLPSEDTVAIAPTDSTGGRSDLIVARVENPHIGSEPWGAPTDPTVGPYIFTRVISNVPAGATTLAEAGRAGDSAIVLARIDLPASTGTITQAMITDLRSLSQRQNARYFNLVAPTLAETLTTAGFTNWPDEANFQVDVPSWATHAKVKAILAGIKFGAAGTNGGAGWNVAGDLRIQFGGFSTATYSAGVGYNESNDGGVDKATLMCGGPSLAIDPANRGKKATIRIEGKKNIGSTSLVVDAGSLVSIDVEFVNAAESNA